MRTLLSYSGKGTNRDVALLKTAALHQSPCQTLPASVSSLRKWFLTQYEPQLGRVLTQVAGSVRVPPEWGDYGLGALPEEPDFPGLVVDSAVDAITRISADETVENWEAKDLENLADANLSPDVASVELPADIGAADIARLLMQEDPGSRIEKATPKELALGLALANVYVDGPGASWLAALGGSSEKDRWGLVAFCTPAILPIASALLRAGFDASELLKGLDSDSASEDSDGIGS
jgi:hypothetical protein